MPDFKQIIQAAVIYFILKRIPCKNDQKHGSGSLMYYNNKIPFTSTLKFFNISAAAAILSKKIRRDRCNKYRIEQF